MNRLDTLSAELGRLVAGVERFNSECYDASRTSRRMLERRDQTDRPSKPRTLRLYAELIEHLNTHGPCSTQALADRFKKTRSTLFTHLLKIEHDGQIYRTGRDKAVRWAIKDDQNQ